MKKPQKSPAPATKSGLKMQKNTPEIIAVELAAPAIAAKPSNPTAGTLSALANGYMAASQSSATVAAYALDEKMFRAAGGTIPSSPTQIVEFLAAFAGKLAVATLERRLTGIHRAHLDRGLVSPVHDPLVKKTMAGIKRTFGVRQRQVRPILKDDLLAMMVMSDRQKPKKAARDKALLLVGFAGAFRRSELVDIECQHVTEHDNGIEILLVRSKTDQSGAGRTVFIPHANGDRCPVLALREWLKISEIETGHVFRSVDRHDRIANAPLTAQSVALIIKNAIGKVGGPEADVSGHSMRAGYCTQAAIAGLQPFQIREQTGHTSDATLARYIRPVAKRKIPSLL
ncbi:integrase [Variovorax boronicumulans]|uniref:site-specific integrase n=1 Tax=Variovorax boronicumulans TaxID=436515 RepID=UPI00277F02EF|nr:site-specific integrase [Variovorax boronicumulans]MDP9993808.1 integrase [Variovorax boronicumulans]MDQ0005327.1 integrase [Variovorax boronicumulans]